MADISQHDLNFITQQLGRHPDGVLSVAKRCPAGHPFVLEVAPVVRGKPFPTVYWLCCNQVKKQIDRVEAQGEIAAIENELRSDANLAALLTEDHRRYAALRTKLVKTHDKKNLAALGALQKISDSGVGGIKNWSQVRCLHMHLAFYFAKGSEFGALLEKRYNIQTCSR